MDRTEAGLVVADAGPIIHLDELGCLDLLNDFNPLVPFQVWREVRRHRPDLKQAPSLRLQLVDVAGPVSPSLSAMVESFGLAIGEAAALALIERLNVSLLLCDDAAARLAAESLGCAVRGTIGIIVRARRRALRSGEEVIALLENLPFHSSLHIKCELLEQVISLVKHETNPTH